jgi:hypothetical protein
MDHYNVKFLNVTRSANRKVKSVVVDKMATSSVSDEQTVFQARRLQTPAGMVCDTGTRKTIIALNHFGSHWLGRSFGAY